MAKTLKIGIIGMGTIGPVHAAAIQATGEAELAIICDIDKNKLDDRGKRFNVANRVEDYRQLLASDVDAVYVCVGNNLHRDFAVAALQAGKNVFLEKPMAMNAQQAAQIVAAQKKSGKVLQIGMVQRQQAQSQVVRDYIQKGLFGDIYHMRAVLIRRRGIPGLGGWFTTKALSGGGPIIDIGVHWFDLSMWLADAWKPRAVSAMTYAKFGPRMKGYKYVDMWAGPPNFKGAFDVEDYATGFVRFDNDATLSFQVAWALNAADEAHVNVMGDKGGARLMDGKVVNMYGEDNGRVADLQPKFPDVNGFEMQARTFFAACRGEAAPGEQGLAVMKLIDAIYASSASGKEVTIK